jgi:hypothetical protein
MKEVRRKAGIEKDEMKEKERIQFERLLKQERFLDIAKTSMQLPLSGSSSPISQVQFI